MTTGSHNQQIYWYATGNSRILGQLPAIWLTADRQWIPRRAAVMRPPGGSHVSETGGWNGICVACHTTNGQPQLDSPLGSQPILTQTADTRATEFGVACESCHGPSEAHARANRNPLTRYAAHLTGRPDPTIVQPMRLPPARSSQVCGQCHSFWEFADPQSERHANSRGLPYRPGDDLAATRFIVQPTSNLESPTMQAFLEADAGFIRDIFWSDGMVRATGREYNGLDRVAVLQERDRRGADDVVLLVPHDAQDGRRRARRSASGPTISSRRARSATTRACSAIPR